MRSYRPLVVSRSRVAASSYEFGAASRTEHLASFFRVSLACLTVALVTLVYTALA